MFGKLHFGNNPLGVDEFMILPGQGFYYNPRFHTSSGDTTITGYVTDIITDLAIDWLDHRREPGKPFLLMYLHKAPHRSWLPKEEHFREYTQKEFPVPSSLFDNYRRSGEPGARGISTAAASAEMNILEHMTLGYDNKIRLETLLELGIEERHMNLRPLSKM